MIEDIKEGMYIRTPRGQIGIMYKDHWNELCINFGTSTYDDKNCMQYMISKASFNIIDLIEKEDVLRVKEKYNTQRTFILEVECVSENERHEKIITLKGRFPEFILNDYELLGIVTKEQYKSIEYTVDDSHE